jgi:hypothetical protein
MASCLTKEFAHEDTSPKVICPPDHRAAPFVLAILRRDERSIGCRQRPAALLAEKINSYRREAQAGKLLPQMKTDEHR